MILFFECTTLLCLTQNIHSLIIKFRATNFTQLIRVGLDIQYSHYQTFHWITAVKKAWEDKFKNLSLEAIK